MENRDISREAGECNPHEDETNAMPTCRPGPWNLLRTFQSETFLRRAEGPETSQPRATPWVNSQEQRPALKGRHQLYRPFRAGTLPIQKPRALPWARLFAHLGCSLFTEQSV